MWPLILMSNDAFNALHFHYNQVFFRSDSHIGNQTHTYTHNSKCDLITTLIDFGFSSKFQSLMHSSDGKSVGLTECHKWNSFQYTIWMKYQHKPNSASHTSYMKFIGISIKVNSIYTNLRE